MQTAAQKMKVDLPTDLVMDAEGRSAHGQRSETQDFFLGEDFILRRHDYDTRGGRKLSRGKCVYDYADVAGLLLPTKQRALMRGADDRPIPEPLMLSIDLTEIQFG